MLIQDGVHAFQRLRQSAGPDMSSRLPAPPTLESLRDLDPELYAAWRAHVLEGFNHNREMFERLVEAFMGPYYTTVWLYRVTFGVGLTAFLTAVGLSLYTGQAMFGLVFGGVGVATFVTFFLSRPLRALEENLNFITWLGVIYNTYWTRLVYAMNMDSVQDRFGRHHRRLQPPDPRVARQERVHEQQPAGDALTRTSTHGR